MIFKSYIVEQNFSKIENCKIFLFYGENQGLKKDLKEKIKKENKNIEILRLYQDEIVKNKNLLINEIINKSLFNDKKILFIEQANDKILHALEDIQEKIQNEKIFIFADILDKRSKLRTLFEKEEGLAVIPCYEDNDRTLINYINKQLNGFKGITGELINLIITNSSSNRKVIQTELTKVKEFFSNKIINKSQLLEILNIKNNSNFDEIRDNVLIGKKDKTNRLLSEIDFLQEDSFLYLNSLNYRILKLIEIKKTSKEFSDDEETLNKHGEVFI